MRSFARHIGLLALFILLIIAGALRAQDEITVVGSGIVEPVLQALVDASGVDASFDLSVTGTGTGFERFCAGEADMTTATRQMTSDERAICDEKQVTPLELTLGHNILAFISNPSDASFLTCLTGAELNTVYAPSSEGEISNWNQVLSDGPDLALAAYALGDVTPEFTILDSLIEGDGIRGDAVVTASADEVIAQVSSTSGAVGVVTLPQALAAGDAIHILEIDAAAIQGCQAPSATAVEDSLYPAGEPLRLYVNVAGLSKAGLSEFLNYAASKNAPGVVESVGFVPPTEITAQANLDNLQAALTGEFSAQSNIGFTIPAGLTGQVNIGGAGDGYKYLKASVDAFNVLTPGVTANLNVEGLPAGARRLCNGELDFIYTYRDLTDEEAGNCEANNISLLSIDVGTPAAVLLANEESDYLACLTTDALLTVWRAQPGDAVVNWNQVDSTFPDALMTLFSPPEGNLTMDLLLLSVSDSSAAGRVDIQLDDDPLYRAAATANVPGALTFMSWSEYQDVLANNQANIQLIAVDGGSGCVMPDTATIVSSQYPLTRPGKLLINRSQLTRIEVQSLLWFMFSTDNFSTYEANDYVGIRLSDLEVVRNALLAAFEEARIAAAEATPEPEVMEEATSEATAESK